MIHGGTAFAAAVQNGHLDVVKYLGDSGADTGIPIHDGATPIFIACYRGNREIVECVLCRQLKSPRRLCDGGPPPPSPPPLARVPATARTRYLISKKVKLETPNNNGNTPMSIACQHRRLDIAELLLEQGVSMQPVNKKGSTPFFFACQEGNLDVVKFLARNGVDTSHGKNGISPFHMACYRGHLDVVT